MDGALLQRMPATAQNMSPFGSANISVEMRATAEDFTSATFLHMHLAL